MKQTKTVEEFFTDLGWVQTSESEWSPAVLFTDEVVRKDWLGTPYGWVYSNGRMDKDFETFEELIEFLKPLDK